MGGNLRFFSESPRLQDSRWRKQGDGVASAAGSFGGWEEGGRRPAGAGKSEERKVERDEGTGKGRGTRQHLSGGQGRDVVWAKGAARCRTSGRGGGGGGWRGLGRVRPIGGPGANGIRHGRDGYVHCTRTARGAVPTRSGGGGLSANGALTFCVNGPVDFQPQRTHRTQRTTRRMRAGFVVKFQIWVDSGPLVFGGLQAANRGRGSSRRDAERRRRGGERGGGGVGGLTAGETCGFRSGPSAAPSGLDRFWVLFRGFRFASPPAGFFRPFGAFPMWVSGEKRVESGWGRGRRGGRNEECCLCTPPCRLRRWSPLPEGGWGQRRTGKGEERCVPMAGKGRDCDEGRGKMPHLRKGGRWLGRWPEGGIVSGQEGRGGGTIAIDCNRGQSNAIDGF